MCIRDSRESLQQLGLIGLQRAAARLQLLLAGPRLRLGFDRLFESLSAAGRFRLCEGQPPGGLIPLRFQLGKGPGPLITLGGQGRRAAPQSRNLPDRSQHRLLARLAFFTQLRQPFGRRGRLLGRLFDHLLAAFDFASEGAQVGLGLFELTSHLLNALRQVPLLLVQSLVFAIELL